jgi:succinate dehydrogenase / fumarate reductase flavoprotein subunit
MAEAAPGIVFMLDRMGVPFNRTAEGLLDFRRFGGTLYHRTAFAGATTGQQLLYALDEQVRRWETTDVTDEHGVSIPARRWSGNSSSGTFSRPCWTTTASASKRQRT